MSNPRNQTCIHLPVCTFNGDPTRCADCDEFKSEPKSLEEIYPAMQKMLSFVAKEHGFIQALGVVRALTMVVEKNFTLELVAQRSKKMSDDAAIERGTNENT